MTSRMANGVELKLFSSDHVEQTFSWVSNPALQRDFMIRGEVTWDGHQAYFARVLADPNQRVYAICIDGRHVGNCGFKDIDRDAGVAELWIYIGDPSTRGCGIGAMAIRSLVDEGRATLSLHRILVHVAESNEPARKLYAQAGFVVAGEGGPEWQERGIRILRMALTMGSA